MLAIQLVAASSAFAAVRPNVLFIAVDDLRVELGCYGDTPVLTPNIDRLAKRGVVFERAYCQQALCNPSRASLLTGRRPDTLRIWDLPTHLREWMPDVVTLPQHFKNHGYFTRGIGKIFHNWRQEIHGDPRSWSVPSVMHYNTHGADEPMFGDGAELPPNRASHPRVVCRDVPDEAYFDGRIAILAVKELAVRAKGDEPFFLAVGFWKPHLPFNAPKKYWDLYEREKIELPVDPRPPNDGPKIALHDARELLRAKKTLTEADVRELRHGYYAAISYLDAQVGKVLDAVDEHGFAENTIVVFWSDHGFHLGEHGLWAKTSCFELDARVPLIIASPGAKRAGRTTSALVELLDLYPTLVDLAALPMPSGLEGTSLVPLLDGTAESVKPAAFTQHPPPGLLQGPTRHDGLLRPHGPPPLHRVAGLRDRTGDRPRVVRPRERPGRDAKRRRRAVERRCRPGRTTPPATRVPRAQRGRSAVVTPAHHRFQTTTSRAVPALPPRPRVMTSERLVSRERPRWWTREIRREVRRTRDGNVG